eukprot:2647672-Rhodomonas_salina.1
MDPADPDALCGYGLLLRSERQEVSNEQGGVRERGVSDEVWAYSGCELRSSLRVWKLKVKTPAR